MFITYISQWLYIVMQLPVPIVLSPKHIYSITIFNLFIGSLILGILLLLFERAINGLRFSDFRVKEKAPETVDISISSNSLNSVDNIGRKRFPRNSSRSLSSIGQRIVKNKYNKNIGIRLTENKVEERNKMEKNHGKDDEQ